MSKVPFFSPVAGITGRLPALTLLIASLLLLGACGGSTTQGATPGPMPPAKVKVAQPLAREVVEWDHYTGRIEPIESVEIRARVSGVLDQVNVKAGDRVKKGDLLFLIDQRPYRAELNRVESELDQAKARRDLARAELARTERLLKARAASAEEQDTRRKDLREAEAAVRTADAATYAARLNLEFTEIRAPITGKVGRELVTVGNLINAGGDAAPLSFIVSTDPVYVYFDADERAVLNYRRMARSGQRVPLELALADESGFPHKGSISYVEPRSDPGTGTSKVRGLIPNADDWLSPGFFARVRVQNGAPHRALLLPDRAVATDQGQKFVWVVKADHSAEYRRVSLGAHIDSMQVIREGLAPEDRVVVEGVQKVRPGAKVEPESVQLSESSNEAG